MPETAPRRIDAHAHVLPDAYLARLKLPDGSPFPLPPAPLERLEETMERFAVDAAVVSTGPPGAFLGDQERANELARVANEAIADIVRAEPDRFAGLALLPLPDVEAALAELEHALDVLALDGVLLLTSVAGTYLGDRSWDPLFDELERRGTYVFVHPGFPPHAPPLPQHPIWLYEFTFETVRAVANLVYSGTLERCPSVRLQLAHLGGAVPFLAHRLASLAGREPQLAADAPAGALAYLSRLYYDTGLSNHAPALAATLEVAPLEHVLFGTDWPYADLPPEGDDPAPDLEWLGDRRNRVDAVNAGVLVPRLASAGRSA
ncbi:MAG TPA: amidohydrolase family protein [Gaiellaceae bacterium]|jgi:predicted TIM-barrel fold metal-dependent hydrolase